MKLKKLLKMVGPSADAIGLYRFGYHIGNFKANNIPSEILDCKIDYIWTGIIYRKDCDIPNGKLNITLKDVNNDQ